MKKREILEKTKKDNPEKFKKFSEEHKKTNESIDIKDYINEDGYINLDEIPYIKYVDREEMKNIGCYVEKWILFPNLQQILAKNVSNYDLNMEKLSEEERFQEKVHRYNDVFLTQVFKQLEIPSARYYFAREEEKDYLVTPSLIQENEELINGEKILKNMLGKVDETFVSEELEEIEGYLRETLNITDIRKIEEIKDSFIKQVIALRYINLSDFDAREWGLILNEEKKDEVKMFPMVDIDSSCGYEELTDIINLSDNETSKFEDIVMQYKENKSVRNLLAKMTNIDIGKAIEDTYNDTKIIIPQDIVEHYEEYFEYMRQRTQEILNKIELEKVQKETQER